MKAKQAELIFRNGARSPIVLGLVPLTSLNRSFLWLTNLSYRQTVTVPWSTRTHRRLKRSGSCRSLPEETDLKGQHPGPTFQKEKKTGEEAFKRKAVGGVDFMLERGGRDRDQTASRRPSLRSAALRRLSGIRKKLLIKKKKTRRRNNL